METASILEQLQAVIEARRDAPGQRSYTRTLLEAGLPKISEKLLEEARETVEASAELGPEGRTHLIHESADLLYHWLVLLAWRGVSLREVEAELARRFGTSGLDEKAARGNSPSSPP